jgi:hypothetical protein
MAGMKKSIGIFAGDCSRFSDLRHEILTPSDRVAHRSNSIDPDICRHRGSFPKNE